MTTQQGSAPTTSSPSTVDQFASKIEALLKSSSTKPWPSFTGGQQQAFEQFQAALKTKFGLTLWADLFKLNASQVAAIDDAAHPANPDDWKAMLSVVNQTLAYKTTIEDVIQGQRIYLIGFQQVLEEITKQTISYVELKQTDPPPPAPFPLTALLNIALAPMSFIPGGVGSFAAGCIKGIIDFTQYLADKGGPDAPNPEQTFNDFTLASLKIQQQFTERFNDGLNGLTLALNTAVADYGKLQGLADMLDESSVIWPQQASGISDEGLKQLEIQLWQLLLPARWPILNLQDIPPFTVVAKKHSDAEQIIEKAMKKWRQSYWQLTGNKVRDKYAGPKEYGWEVLIQTLAEPAENKHRCDPHLAKGSAKRLFKELAVPRADLFNQTNGWDNFKTVKITWPITRQASWVLGD